jgi:hypothetical protein
MNRDDGHMYGCEFGCWNGSDIIDDSCSCLELMAEYIETHEEVLD